MELNALNEFQKQAVITTEGPVMVMAGAGSGKTRVLTYRIAYLILELGVSPFSILAVTFTNKAAKEMKDRVSKILNMDVKDLWVSTFHSFCARFLRREISVLGQYTNHFTIIDDDDAAKIIKELLKKRDYGFLVKDALALISHYKNNEAMPNFSSFERSNFECLYNDYQAELVKNDLLDFDDLILLTVEILERSNDIRRRYNEKFNYVMIDEFQDTNYLQYKLINLLVSEHQNIFVVGDINQSIYSFRGARVENISKFEKLYHPEIIKLEQNYRSTKMILDIANDVICKNQSFANMHLFSDKNLGEKAIHYHADSSYGEVIYVVGEIKKLLKQGYHYKDIAILYRLNSLSLNFENEFIKSNIPYIIYGGVGYFERKEVKDIIAYLRLAVNYKDNFSFKRVLNVPKRKLGEKMLETLADIGERQNISLFEAAKTVNNLNLQSFITIIEELHEALNKLNLSDFIDVVCEKTGYMLMLQNDNDEDRIDNVLELKSIMKDISESYEGTNEEKLSAFLLDLALKTNVDDVNESDDKVKLMSFHQAKGLEYPIVFMIAMEQGIFPSYNSMGSTSEIEEERRICYVGITRAMEKLYFTDTHIRRLYGRDNVAFPSQFLKDIKKERLLEKGYGVHDTFFTAKEKVLYNKGKTYDDGTIKCGDKIMHKIFGKGIVVNASDGKITVAFGVDVGIKVLLANHPSITKIKE